MTKGAPFEGPDSSESPPANLVSLEEGRRKFRPLDSTKEPSPKTPGPPPPPPPKTPDLSLKKLRAKRINEHVKSAYSLSNTLAAAVIGAAYILPEIKGDAGPQELDRPNWVIIGLVIAAFGHLIIWKGMRKED